MSGVSAPERESDVRMRDVLVLLSLAHRACRKAQGIMMAEMLWRVPPILDMFEVSTTLISFDQVSYFAVVSFSEGVGDNPHTRQVNCWDNVKGHYQVD